MAPRTRAATRFALLELNDDLLRSVLLLCGVDSLRALLRVSTRLRKLAHETLRLAKWRELPGNADVLRDALWAAGQFTTRVVAASNSDSVNEAIIQDDIVVASTHSDEVLCFGLKTGRFMFGMDAEVGKIAVQGGVLAVGLMGLFPESNCGVQIWGPRGGEGCWGEEAEISPSAEQGLPVLIKELETVGFTCTGLGWLGPGVLITHTADEQEVTLQMWKGPEWEEAHRNSYAMVGGWTEPWENNIFLEVQEKEQRIFTTLTLNTALGRDPDAEETIDAVIYRWDPERLGGLVGEPHVEAELEWLSKDDKVLMASGDFLAGALTEHAHSSTDAVVKIWKILPTSLEEWCTFPVENRVATQFLLLGDLLMCSARVGADPALAINSVSQRVTLRTVRFPVLPEPRSMGRLPTYPPQLLGFDATGSTLVFATNAPVGDSVDISSYLDERLGVGGAQLLGASPKLLVHELSGIW